MALAGISSTNDQNTEQKHTRYRSKSDVVLAQKLRNLQEFAKVYHLDLYNDDDRRLKTDRARENVRQMVRDLLSSANETNERNLDQLVVQVTMTGNYHRPLNQRSKLQTYYQELLEVMPNAWKEIFHEEQEKLV